MILKATVTENIIIFDKLRVQSDLCILLHGILKTNNIEMIKIYNDELTEIIIEVQELPINVLYELTKYVNLELN